MARPTVMTGELVAKLEFAYSCNCNDTEACLYANIDPKTLDRYEEKHPEFRVRKQVLRSKPRMTSKMIQAQQLGEDCGKTAEFVLTHTDDEYSTKNQTKHSGDIGINPAAALLDAVRGKLVK